MKEHKSCGIIVFCEKEKQKEFLLLHYLAGHWDLPKGHEEREETEEETALRELQEETGLKLKPVDIFPGFNEEIEYFYRSGKKLQHKTVSFYLAEAHSQEITISKEHIGFEWLPYKKALEKLTFKTAKTVLRKAQEFLKQEKLF